MDASWINSLTLITNYTKPYTCTIPIFKHHPLDCKSIKIWQCFTIHEKELTVNLSQIKTVHIISYFLQMARYLYYPDPITANQNTKTGLQTGYEFCRGKVFKFLCLKIGCLYQGTNGSRHYVIYHCYPTNHEGGDCQSSTMQKSYRIFSTLT